MLPLTAQARPLSPADARADLAYLHDKILAQDSNPWLYIPQDRFEALYRKTRAGLNRPVGRIEFYRRAAALAAALRDGHTLVDPLIDDFQAYAVRGGVFPAEVSFVEGRLYVTTNASGDPHLAPGSEITAINGASVAQIVEAYRGIINDVHPVYDIYARLFRELYWMRFGAPERFVIRWRHGHQTGTAHVPAHVFAADQFHSYNAPGSTYGLRMLPHNVALLTINSFTPSDGFSPFMAKSFATLDENHVNDLIIDIRRNGGGSGRLAQEVISYLTDKPYKLIGAFYVKVTDDLKALYAEATTHTDEDTRKIVMTNPAGALVDGLKDSGPVVVTPPYRDHVFHGHVYLLTANNTFSAAAMFTAYFKCNGLGTVVGQPPGQSTNFVADAVPFTMPHSGLRFTVSFSEIHMPCEQSYYHGISPDIRVEPSTASIAAGRDSVLDATRKLIAERRRAVR
ncbi:MAG: hypothetical protein JSR60_11855 [Proteobacteria bacterium]|nr:hypothetical protein [Pseudomonadota bacterium]